MAVRTALPARRVFDDHGHELFPGDIGQVVLELDLRDGK
jgi:hypothetical protein